MVKTINEMFEEAVRNFSDKVALKERNKGILEETSYDELSDLVKGFGIGLINIGLMPQDKICLISDNGKKWLVSDLAILGAGGIDVPRGSDSTPHEISYIINHSGAKFVIVEDTRQLEKINSILYKLSALEKVIILESPKGASQIKPDIPLYDYDELLNMGRTLINNGDKTLIERSRTIREDDVVTIVYTSGTTGNPKGVVLTHSNIISNTHAVNQILKITPDDRFLSILPPWHMYERMANYVALRNGSSIAYTNPRNVGKDLVMERPTFFPGVPRIWQAFYDRVMNELNSRKGFTRRLTGTLLKLSKAYIISRRILLGKEPIFKKRGTIQSLNRRAGSLLVMILLWLTHYMADVLVYRKIRANTGNSLRSAITGGGFFPDQLEDFFEIVGIPIINGYGLTETSPIIALRSIDHNMRGSVGRPLPDTELKIVDHYGKEVQKGEVGVIWVKGPQLMSGYYKDEENTKRVFKDGDWFDTGDLGRISLTGDLFIVGRAKDTIVLSGGENVEPEPIETFLQQSLYIDQAMLVGQDRKYLGALIVPNFTNLKGYARDMGIKDKDMGELLHDTRILSLIKKEINDLINYENGFAAHEKIHKFILIKDGFSIENGLMTPTLKLKRNIITESYKGSIENLFI